MNGSRERLDDRAVYFPVDGMVAVFQPGDMTKYEFFWCAAQPGFVRVAGTPGFGMYEYDIESIERCYETYRELVGTRNLPGDKKGRLEPYLGYVIEHSGNCNPWTAWAMIQCLAERWEKTGGIID